MKKSLLLVIVLVAAGCMTTPPGEPVVHIQIFDAEKSPEELYIAAMVGMWRIYRAPNATIQYHSADLGLIISEGYTSVFLNPDSLGMTGSMTVYFRLVLEVKPGRVRVTVEDVHTAGRYGLYGDTLTAFRAEIQDMMATLAAAIHAPAW